MIRNDTAKLKISEEKKSKWLQVKQHFFSSFFVINKRTSTTHNNIAYRFTHVRLNITDFGKHKNVCILFFKLVQYNLRH